MKDNKNFIGNIITTNKKPIFNRLCKVCYNYDDIIPSLPTLIIGLDLAKKYISNFNIMNKCYNDGMLYWTFRKIERRDDYNNDLLLFYENCYNKVFNNIKYQYIDLVNYNINSCKKVIRFINSNLIKYCFLTKDSNFCFIYSKDYNTVFGLSLTYLEYIGIKKDKVKKKLMSNRNNLFIFNTEFMDSYMYKVIKENTHLIPVIGSYFNI